MSLGLPANFTFHRRAFLFSDNAIQYVQDQFLDQTSESESDSSSLDSFSSGIYSSLSSDSSEPEAFSVPKIPRLSKLPPVLSEQEEFGSEKSSEYVDNIDNVSDTDSDIDHPTQQRVETLLRRNTTNYGSIPLVRNSMGKLLIVPQIQDYHFRNEKLYHFSLYEFVCISFRREITSKKNKAQETSSSHSSSDQHNESGAKTSRSRRGRKPSILFNFQPEHPLHDSHALALHRKHFIAQFIQKIPPYPGKRPEPLTDTWKSRARKFAEFALVVFRPWQGPNGLPESTTWKSFCEWMQTLRSCDSILSRTRAAFVVNAAHNLKFISSVSKILKRFRGSNATRWLDMPAHKRPTAWMFGDEATVEKDLPSKNSEREAALAMQELLQKICFDSSSESKKAELMRSTLQSYRSAIQISLQCFSGISLLLGESPPLLINRIDCFPVDHIRMVQEQNILKLTDQALMRQLKRKKQKLNNSTNPPCSPLPDTQSQDISWSPQQAKIISAVTDFLERFTAWKSGHSPPPPSLSLLIFGGPGVGKTTVLKTISKMCEHASMPLLSSAATGVAAGAMRRAGTNHSTFAIPVFGRGENDSNSFLPRLSQTTINLLMQDFQDSLEAGTPLAVAVDECSMLSALQFGRILRRIEEFEQSFIPTTTNRPPRLFILVGDFYQVVIHFFHVVVSHTEMNHFQIPPCRATPLHVTMLNNFCLDDPSLPASPEDLACRYFQQFKLYKLDIQHRSLDPSHSANLESLRTVDPTVFPITNKLISQYSVLKQQDVLHNPQWLFAPVVVLFNALRHAINMEALQNYARLAGYPILCWRNPLHGSAAAALNSAESNRLYSTHPALSGFFCPGCPAYGKSNINPAKGIFNGAAMTLHSITISPEEDKVTFNQKMQNAQPGQMILLQHPPYAVQVEILNADPATYTSADTLVPGKYVVPIFLDKKSQHEPGSHLQMFLLFSSYC